MKFWPSVSNCLSHRLAKFQVIMTIWCWRKHFLWHVIDIKIGFFLNYEKFNNFHILDKITLKLCILVDNKSKYLQNNFGDVTILFVYFTDQNFKDFDFRGFWAITFSPNHILKKPESTESPLMPWITPENFKSIR